MRNSTILLLTLSLGACAGSQSSSLRAPPAPIKAFPGDMLTGAIPVYPLNNMRVDSTLGMDGELSPSRDAMSRVDSMLHAVLIHRYPTAQWLTPTQLKEAAAKAPGMLTDPYDTPTMALQTHALTLIPGALLSQMRGLAAVASGGRYVLVPANLWFTKTGALTSAHLVVTLADVRMGAVSWSGTLTGVGPDAWKAVSEAVLGVTMVKDQ